MRLTDKTKIITSLEKEIQELKDEIAGFEMKATKVEHKKVASTRSKKTTPQDKVETPETKEKAVKKDSKEKLEKKTDDKVEVEEVQRETKRKNVKISEEELRKVRILLFFSDFFRLKRDCNVLPMTVLLLAKILQFFKRCVYKRFISRRNVKMQLRGRSRRTIVTTT